MLCSGVRFPLELRRSCKKRFSVKLFLGRCATEALPVLIDRKIVQDPALALSEAQVKISETFMFIGWLLGAIALHPLMQRLDLKQVLVLLGVTMLAVSVATVTLPYITMLSMTLLCGVRLLHGMCLNIHGVQYIYMQNCFPGYGPQLCALENTVYAFVSMLMAMSCGTLTLHTDWRVEALMWLGLPLLLGLCTAFPDLGLVVGSLPKALMTPPSYAHSTGLEKAHGMSRSMQKDLVHLAFCFMATVFAYYGLSYSADSLSTNPFLSALLISGSDVFGCMLASRARDLGRNRAQVSGFVVAGVSLIACAMGTVDSVFVLPGDDVGSLYSFGLSQTTTRDFSQHHVANAPTQDIHGNAGAGSLIPGSGGHVRGLGRCFSSVVSEDSTLDPE